MKADNRIDIHTAQTAEWSIGPHDSNPDPLTGDPGGHPFGTGVGVATGGAAGAIMGSFVGGPAGAVVGAAVGAIAGGMAGKVAAEAYNPTAEFGYWYEHTPGAAHGTSGSSLDDYAPAFRYGWKSQGRYPGQQFESVEIELANGWDKVRGESGLSWDDARVAARDAWQRLEIAMPGGDADNGTR